MLNDKYAMESSKLSDMESILNNIGFLSEEKEKEDHGEKEEHKYKKSGKKSKDYDGDGEVEDESHEYAGVKDRAIKKAMKKESVEIDSIFEEMSIEDIIFLTDELIEETVEEFFSEMIEEGYDIEELSEVLVESIDAELTLISEAKVTLGHDTPDSEQKTNKLSKLKDVIKRVASGAKKVAKKVAGAAGEVAGAAVSGYKKTSDSQSTSSTPKQTTSSTSTSNKPSFLQRAGSALKKGLKKVVGKTARMASKVGDKVATRLGEETLDEKAPPGAKYERMVNHIKKGYSKDGLSDKEKSIAYATAWKAKNKAMKEEKEDESEAEEEKEKKMSKSAKEKHEKVEDKKEKEMKEDKDPCWKGYQMVGMKKKGGKEVPNCVPKEEYEDLVRDMIEEGYDMDQVRDVIGALEDGLEVIFEDDQYIINNDEIEMIDEEFLCDVEIVADWLYSEGVIENEDQFFELMEDLTEEEIQELYDVVMEAMSAGPRRDAMIAKSQKATSKDRANIHNIAVRNDTGPSYEKKSTGGKGSRYPGYGDRGAGNKSARRSGNQPMRGNKDPRKQEGYEMIGNSLEEGGLEVRNYSWREVFEGKYMKKSKK